jgi:hypothetical protein
MNESEICASCGHWEATHHPDLPAAGSCWGSTCGCERFVPPTETCGIRLYLCRCGHYRGRHDERGRCLEHVHVRGSFFGGVFSRCSCAGFVLRDCATLGAA